MRLHGFLARSHQNQERSVGGTGDGGRGYEIYSESSVDFMLFIQLIVARNGSSPKMSALYTLFTQWALRDWLIPEYSCGPIRLPVHFHLEPDWGRLLHSESYCSRTNQTAAFWILFNSVHNM